MSETGLVVLHGSGTQFLAPDYRDIVLLRGKLPDLKITLLTINYYSV